MTTLYRVRIVATGPVGSPWINTWFFNESSGSAQDAVNATGLFYTHLSAGAFRDDMTWATEPDVSLINDDTGEIIGVDSTSPYSLVGTSVTDAVPTVAQVLLRLRTGTFINGRELRGRLFIPGITETRNDAIGDVDSVLVAAVNDAADEVIDDANSEWRVYSRTHSTSRAVAVGSCWSKWAVMRSRRD